MSRFDSQGEAFQRLIKFCGQQAVWFVMDYSESEDNMSIELCSAAKTEQYFMKRVYDIDYFIKAVKDEWKARGLKVE